MVSPVWPTGDTTLCCLASKAEGVHLPRAVISSPWFKAVSPDRRNGSPNSTGLGRWEPPPAAIERATSAAVVVVCVRAMSGAWFRPPSPERPHGSGPRRGAASVAPARRSQRRIHVSSVASVPQPIDDGDRCLAARQCSHARGCGQPVADVTDHGRSCPASLSDIDADKPHLFFSPAASCPVPSC